MAIAWEAAQRSERGLPPAIQKVFDEHDGFRGARLLLRIPEHQVQLDGGGHPSQSDLWMLLDTPLGMVSAAVEGKAGEKFAELVIDWRKDAKPTSGKPDRLQQLCRTLGITADQADQCRYQLLHRSVSSVIEAKRFGLQHALFLVQSFATDQESLEDFRCFAKQMQVDIVENAIVGAGQRDGVFLWLAWASCDPASDAVIASTI